MENSDSGKTTDTPGSGPSPVVGPTIQLRWLVAGLVGLHVLAIVAIVAPVISTTSMVRAVPVVLATFLVPGGLTLLLIDRTISVVSVRHLLYSVGVSLGWILALGLTLNLALPPMGLERPMAVPILVGAITAVIAVLVVGLAWRGDFTRRITFPFQPSTLLAPAPLALLLLPFASILAVEYLDRTGSNVAILGILVVIAVIPFAVAARAVPQRWLPLAAYAMALALLYHVNFNGEFWFTGNPDVVIGWQLQLWTPGLETFSATSSELLTNSVLYPVIALLSGTHILVELNVINPLLVATIPLSLFVAFRSYTTDRVAFLGASVIMFAHPFMIQYPTAGRAAGPVIFLAFLAVALSDRTTPRFVRTALALTFVVGVVVSHYGTAWFVLFALVGGIILVLGYALMDRLLGAIRGDSVGILEEVRGVRDHLEPRLFSVSFVMYYVVVAIGWYLFTVGGGKFESLVNHVERAILDLYEGDFFTGATTTTRVAKDYGSVSISLSKRVYLVLGAFMIVGFLAAYLSRFRADRESRFDDGFLGVASMMFVLFGSTFALGEQWSGGRPMMITFTFTGIFAVVGLIEVFGGIRSVLARIDPSGWIKRVSPIGIGAGVFAVVMFVLLVLNTGVAAAGFIGGAAPVGVPIQGVASENPSFQGSGDIDLETHAWLLDHRNRSLGVYGDVIARGQTDWYRPMLALRTDRFFAFPYSGNKPEWIYGVTEGYRSGYVIVLSHNGRTNQVVGPETKYEWTTMAPVQPHLDRSGIIYTSGVSAVYYAPSRTRDR